MDQNEQILVNEPPERAESMKCLAWPTGRCYLYCRFRPCYFYPHFSEDQLLAEQRAKDQESLRRVASIEISKIVHRGSHQLAACCRGWPRPLVKNHERQHLSGKLFLVTVTGLGCSLCRMSSRQQRQWLGMLELMHLLDPLRLGELASLVFAGDCPLLEIPSPAGFHTTQP